MELANGLWEERGRDEVAREKSNIGFANPSCQARYSRRLDLDSLADVPELSGVHKYIS